MMPKYILLIIFYSTVSFSSNFDICKPDKSMAPLFHFLWIGNSIFDNTNTDKINNLKNFCEIFSGIKDANIYLWSDKEVNSREINDKANCKIIQTKNIKQLLDHSNILKNGYEYFFNNAIFAAATDILRPIIIKKNGGCYRDIGTKFNKDASIEPLDPKGSANHLFFVEQPRQLGISPDWEEPPPAKLAPAYDISKVKPPMVETGTPFYNNAFMAAPLNSPMVDLVLGHYEKKLGILLKNSILQLFYDKKMPLYNTQAILGVAGPLSFTAALLTRPEKLGVVRLKGFEHAGSLSWSNHERVTKENRLARKQMALAVLTCARDFGFIDAKKMFEIFHKCHVKINATISSNACLFEELSTNLKAQGGQPNLTFEQVDKLKKTFLEMGQQKCHALNFNSASPMNFQKYNDAVMPKYQKKDWEDAVKLQCELGYLSPRNADQKNFDVDCICNGFDAEALRYGEPSFSLSPHLKEPLKAQCGL